MAEMRDDELKTGSSRRGPEPGARTAVATGVRPERWTDCHCRLPAFGPARETVLRDAAGASVMRLVDVGFDVVSSIDAATSAVQFEGVWSTAPARADRATGVLNAQRRRSLPVPRRALCSRLLAVITELVVGGRKARSE